MSPIATAQYRLDIKEHAVVSLPLIPLSTIFDRWLPVNNLFNTRDAKVFSNVMQDFQH